MECLVNVHATAYNGRFKTVPDTYNGRGNVTDLEYKELQDGHPGDGEYPPRVCGDNGRLTSKAENGLKTGYYWQVVTSDTGYCCAIIDK